MYRCDLAGKHFYIFTFIFSPSIEIKIRSFRKISLSIVNSVGSRQDKKDINDDTHFSE